MFDLGSFDNIFDQSDLEKESSTAKMSKSAQKNDKPSAEAKQGQNLVLNANYKPSSQTVQTESHSVCPQLTNDDIESLDFLFEDDFTIDSINASTSNDEAMREICKALNSTNPPIVAPDQGGADMKPNMAPRQFKTVSDTELDELQAKRQSKATKSSTKWGVELFQGKYYTLF